MANGNPRVLISNGYGQFHMAPLANEIYARGMLAGLITGAYPRRYSMPYGLSDRSMRYRRFQARRLNLPDGMVWPIWSGEVLYQASQAIWGPSYFERLHLALACSSLVRYQAAASSLLRRKGDRVANIYHFRSGFGGQSAQHAREMGMKSLCDHTIVHPSALEYLLKNEGRLPSKVEHGPPNTFWRMVEADLSEADAILVNSHFVQETFVRCGIPRERVKVLYYGPDEAFFKLLRPFTESVGSGKGPNSGPLRILSAGTLQWRKGSHILALSLRAVSADDLVIDVVGDWHPQLLPYRQDLEVLRHIHLSPKLDRSRLAEAMARADVFVLPTLAEGSARVVFEAMAAGCYIITTPNAGSIVRDGEHGRLIEPGSVNSLSSAIEEARSDIARIREIGSANTSFVRARYGPGSNAERISGLYRSLLPNC